MPVFTAFRNYVRQLHSPSTYVTTVVLSDTVDLPDGPTRGIYVATSGDVSVIMADGETAVTLPGLAAGVVHPFAVGRIRATNTTVPVGDILAVY
jgi:hypothetical protein